MIYLWCKDTIKERSIKAVLSFMLIIFMHYLHIYAKYTIG